ncbi:hypothetical protein THOM_2522 [Trachipleistophora hominis]|uniref:Uncharacterized protein n=1 Tax=Trachipleistophora hominis TaxID=72359 RepID=L7JT04_TRAHO|nr:hypothetical protein THOM_2522 [Trachipleistophora hominis]
MYVRRPGLCSIRIRNKENIAEEIHEKTGIPPEKQFIHVTKRGPVLLLATNKKIGVEKKDDSENDERKAEILKMTKIFEDYMDDDDDDDITDLEITLKKEHVKDITRNILND